MGKEVFEQSPLYPYLLALYFIVFGQKLFLLRVLQFGLAPSPPSSSPSSAAASSDAPPASPPGSAPRSTPPSSSTKDRS